jgi:LPS-assembly protein
MVSSARFATVRFMRKPLILLAAALVLSAAADDRFVCTPATDGSGWVCVEDAEGNASSTWAGPGSGAAANQPAGLRTLDWVPREKLSAGELAVLPRYCDGTYRQPPFPLPLTTDDATQPIEASANAAEYWLHERAVLSGGVKVRQGNSTLSTRQATYLEPTQQVTAAGEVTLRRPGLLVYGDTAGLAVETGAAAVNDAEFVLQNAHLRGTATRLSQDEQGTLSVSRGRFTRCEPGDDSWTLSSKSVEIERGATHGVARNAVLRVGKVPVLYTPYIRFPVTDERLSGFLFPVLGYDQKDGADLALPYYLNLAPNYDATITPRYISERGVGGELEFRHLSRRTHTELGGAYLVDDDQYNGDISRDDFETLGLTGPFKPADRWLATAGHQGRFGAFATVFNYAEVSDRDYFRDLGTNLAVTSRIDLEQVAALSYQQGGLSLRLWAQDFQNLDPLGVDPYRRLPELALRYQGDLVGPLTWSVDASTAEFDRNNDRFFGIDRIVGKRHHVEPRIELPMSWPFGFLNVGGGYRFTSYDLDDVGPGVDDTPERKIWLGRVDGGLFFERDTNLFGGSFLQTLEPRLYYLYQERAEQSQLPLFDATDLTFAYSQLFRDNRFSGLDRIGDANQLAVGVTNRLLDAEGGRERLRASVGQIFYFEDREVTLRGGTSPAQRQSSSALAGELALAVGAGFSVLSTVVYDPHDDVWDEVGAQMQYRGANRGVFNVGYRARRDVPPLLKQTDVSFYWPALKRWALLGRWNYDVTAKRELEAFGGVEFSNCCWQVRLVGRRFLASPDQALAADAEPDDGIFLQVVFKGLAGFGGRIDTLMQDGIRGYRPEEF